MRQSNFNNLKGSARVYQDNSDIIVVAEVAKNQPIITSLNNIGNEYDGEIYSDSEVTYIDEFGNKTKGSALQLIGNLPPMKCYSRDFAKLYEYIITKDAFNNCSIFSDENGICLYNSREELLFTLEKSAQEKLGDFIRNRDVRCELNTIAWVQIVHIITIGDDIRLYNSRELPKEFRDDARKRIELFLTESYIHFRTNKDSTNLYIFRNAKTWSRYSRMLYNTEFRNTVMLEVDSFYLSKKHDNKIFLFEDNEVTTLTIDELRNMFSPDLMQRMKITFGE